MLKQLKYFLLAVTLIICVFSCGKDYSFKRNSEATYLEIENDTPSSLSASDWETVSEAALRMGFYVDGTKLCYRAQSASEINVSENLYKVLLSIVASSNEANLFGSMILTKSINRTTPYDCVAIALCQWGGHSYEEIQGYIDEQGWSGGVPETSLSSLLQHFYPNSFYFSAAYADSCMAFDVTNAIGYYGNRSVSNMAHMVNISSFDGEKFHVFDYQDSTDYDVNMSEMMYVFYNPVVDTAEVDVLMRVIRNSNLSL